MNDLPPSPFKGEGLGSIKGEEDSKRGSWSVRLGIHICSVVCVFAGWFGFVVAWYALTDRK